ncbi:MAG: hypothetical protein IKU34_06335, partial [Clostridia bacterium]|nr:hypothetical protein [Clostridia bacterium]
SSAYAADGFLNSLSRKSGLCPRPHPKHAAIHASSAYAADSFLNSLSRKSGLCPPPHPKHAAIHASSAYAADDFSLFSMAQKTRTGNFPPAWVYQ